MPDDRDDHDRNERHLASHVFNIAMLLFGVAALTWMVRELDWSEFRAVVSGIGWTYAIILALDLAAVLLDARALHTFMRPEARMVSYLRVVAAQISGRAVNVVTPFGALGEATKLTMLVSHAPRGRVLSAVVLFNLTTLYFSVAIMLLGTPITFLLIDLPRSLQVTIGIGLAVLIGLMVALGVVIQRGALSTLTSLLRRLRFISNERREEWQLRLREVDRHIRELHKNRSSGTWRGILWVIAARLVTWAATITLIGAVGAAISPQLVIGVLSVGVLITWISSIVPLGLGLADGGHYVLYELVGASGMHGTFVTMLNRGRSLGVAVVGFLVMALVHTLSRLALGRMRGKLQAMRERAAVQAAQAADTAHAADAADPT
jgi:uncharacterized membrane protein YbhN (UPF0104 family)